jgi:Family of unknown function (DUF6427)
MFLKIFKSNKPVLVFIIPIVAIIIWIPNLINPNSISLQTSLTMPFSQWLVDVLSSQLYIYHIIAIIINIINAFIIIRINNQYILISDRTYLPAFIYLFLTAFIVSFPNSLFLLLNLFFLLIVLYRIFHISTNRNLLNIYFESSFLIGLGTMFYFNAWVFLIIIWITLAYLRPFNWREYFMVILGFISPYFFIGIIYFLSGNFDSIYYFFETNFLAQEKFVLTLKSTIFYSTIAFIFLLSIGSLNLNLIKKKINTRKHYKILLWLSILPIVAYFVLPNITKDLFVFSTIPLTFTFSNFYVSIKNKWIREILFIILLCGIATLYAPI